MSKNKEKGIYLRYNGRYQARVLKDNIFYTVGTFDTISEAVLERNKFIEKL